MAVSSQARQVVALKQAGIDASQEHYAGAELAELEAAQRRLQKRFDPMSPQLRARVLKRVSRSRNARWLWLMLQWLEAGPVSIAHTHLYFDAVARIAQVGSPLLRERARRVLAQAALTGQHSRQSVFVVLSALRQQEQGMSALRLQHLVQKIAA